VADHQIAHIYITTELWKTKCGPLESQRIELVPGSGAKARLGIGHPRAGDLIAISKANAWFTYYYWLTTPLAPDFARCVDIHRKSATTRRLFLDPGFRWSLKILGRLLQEIRSGGVTRSADDAGEGLAWTPADASDYPVLISDKPDTA
jgi:hypothetical protein